MAGAIAQWLEPLPCMQLNRVLSPTSCIVPEPAKNDFWTQSQLWPLSTSKCGPKNQPINQSNSFLLKVFIYPANVKCALIDPNVTGPEVITLKLLVWALNLAVSVTLESLNMKYEAPKKQCIKRCGIMEDTDQGPQVHWCVKDIYS